MDNLRWILLAIGLLLVAGIYVFALLGKSRRPGAAREAVLRTDPEQDGDLDEEVYDDLPSLHALEQARAAQRAEGGNWQPVDPAASASDLTDTQEVPPQAAEETPAVADEPEPEPHSAVNPGLRNNLLRGAGREEPVLDPTRGTALDLTLDTMPDTEQAEPRLHADSLPETPWPAKGGEPQFGAGVLTELKQGGEQIAQALQRRRQQQLNPPRSPIQNAFQFDGDEQKLETESGAAAAAMNRSTTDAAPSATDPQWQEQSGERVRARAEAIKQQSEQPDEPLEEPLEEQARQEAKQTAAEPASAPAPKPEAEPQLQSQPQPQPQPESKPRPPANREEIVVLHIKARDSIGFYGPEMVQCFDDIGIKYGDMHIYHYHSGGQRLLSVANMVEPGTFDPEQMASFTTPGISLFLQLRASSDFALSEQVLVKSAQYIAYQLKGEVLTDKREPLDADKLAELHRHIAAIRSHLQGA